MDDRWFGLGDRGRYLAHLIGIQHQTICMAGRIERRSLFRSSVPRRIAGSRVRGVFILFALHSVFHGFCRPKFCQCFVSHRRSTANGLFRHFGIADCESACGNRSITFLDYVAGKTKPGCFLHSFDQLEHGTSRIWRRIVGRFFNLSR